jgi:hypothetical protein
LIEAGQNLRDDLAPFGAKVLQVPSNVLAEIIANIFVLDRVSAPFGGNLEDLQCLRLLGPLQRAAVFDNAAAWVRRAVLSAAENGDPTLINRTEFDRQIKALFRRVSVAPLAVVFEAPGSMIDPGNYTSHGFFLQLDWIDTDAEFVRDCVIHYVQARVARMRWTDADEVSEESLRAYEQDLKTRWKLHARRQSLRIYPSAIAQGQELLNDTLSEDSVLDGQPMPKAITCGNFHALADFDQETAPAIGWHPGFENIAKGAKDKS